MRLVVRTAKVAKAVVTIGSEDAGEVATKVVARMSEEAVKAGAMMQYFTSLNFLSLEIVIIIYFS